MALAEQYNPVSTNTHMAWLSPWLSPGRLLGLSLWAWRQRALTILCPPRAALGLSETLGQSDAFDGLRHLPKCELLPVVSDAETIGGGTQLYACAWKAFYVSAVSLPR